jgi:hypothetical protein
MPPARGGQDLLPGRAGRGRGADPGRTQDLLYREGRDQVAEPDALALHPCDSKTSSASRDQLIFADSAVGASLSSDAVPLKIDRVRATGSLGDAGTTTRSG